MRYKNEEKARLRSINYELLDSKHNRETAIIYRTIDFGALRDTQIALIEYGIWRQGHSLRRISHDAYSDASFWWTIGLVNNKPTDQHFKIGDKIYIPAQPDVLVNIIGE
tara:strand:- start:287 stop:613 length:327 start_codon:yes stop_codon:yes gene_type:complete